MVAHLGGGFIAAQFGHVFSAFGTSITIVQRGPRLLDGGGRGVGALRDDASRLHRVLLDADRSVGLTTVWPPPWCARNEQVIDAALLLVCVGRKPNTDRLRAVVGGLELDEHGHIAADALIARPVPGVWALGDAVNHFQLKHMANAESRLVRHNILHPQIDARTLTNKVAPHAVFTSPQIAGVGLTEQEARRHQVDYRASVRDYADTAYGWALEDTTGFAKVLADPASARFSALTIGPQAATPYSR